MCNNRQIRPLVQEVGQHFAPTSGPSVPSDSFELGRRESVKCGCAVFDLGLRDEVHIVVVNSFPILVENRCDLDRFFGLSASCKNVNGVEIGVVQLLQSFLPQTRVPLLADILFLADVAESKSCLRAGVDCSLSRSLAFSALCIEVLILDSFLRSLSIY